METVRDLCDFIESDPGLCSLQGQVGRALCDASHDLDHSLRVALWTCRIGGDALPRRNAVAAALCHDIVTTPKNSPDRATASLDSSRRSRDLLPLFGFNPIDVSVIADAIRDHSYSHGTVPSSSLGRALQDADRLDALGAIGIIRHISTAVLMGAKFFDSFDPLAERRPLDETAFAIDHYFTKLLRLPDLMCTDIGRREAERRLQLMMLF
jgi:uncharacterized protein